MSCEYQWSNPETGVIETKSCMTEKKVTWALEEPFAEIDCEPGEYGNLRVTLTWDVKNVNDFPVELTAPDGPFDFKNHVRFREYESGGGGDFAGQVLAPGASAGFTTAQTIRTCVDRTWPMSIKWTGSNTRTGDICRAYGFKTIKTSELGQRRVECATDNTENSNVCNSSVNLKCTFTDPRDGIKKSCLSLNEKKPIFEVLKDECASTELELDIEFEMCNTMDDNSINPYTPFIPRGTTVFPLPDGYSTYFVYNEKDIIPEDQDNTDFMIRDLFPGQCRSFAKTVTITTCKKNYTLSIQLEGNMRKNEGIDAGPSYCYCYLHQKTVFRHTEPEADTTEPTPSPTPVPSPKPTPVPTPVPGQPTPLPTPRPTSSPTPAPMPRTTQAPTPSPTLALTPVPVQPTMLRTQRPTPAPTPGPMHELDEPCDANDVVITEISDPINSATVRYTEFYFPQCKGERITTDITFTHEPSTDAQFSFIGQIVPFSGIIVICSNAGLVNDHFNSNVCDAEDSHALSPVNNPGLKMVAVRDPNGRIIDIFGGFPNEATLVIRKKPASPSDFIDRPGKWINFPGQGDPVGNRFDPGVWRMPLLITEIVQSPKRVSNSPIRYIELFYLPAPRIHPVIRDDIRLVYLDGSTPEWQTGIRLTDMLIPMTGFLVFCNIAARNKYGPQVCTSISNGSPKDMVNQLNTCRNVALVEVTTINNDVPTEYNVIDIYGYPGESCPSNTNYGVYDYSGLRAVRKTSVVYPESQWNQQSWVVTNTPYDIGQWTLPALSD